MPLIENGRLNPGYLKLDLFCKGMRISPDATIADGRPIVRVRSGLGSGLEIRIPGPERIHVNVPVTEHFVRESPYSLHGPAEDGLHRIRYDDRVVASAALPPEPDYYRRKTSSGRPMRSVGVLQGTYLGIYHGVLCANWKRADQDACRFCTIGANLTEGDDVTGKTVEDIVETALAARDEEDITFAHVNGGFDDAGKYLERFGPVMRALKERTGLLTGLQIPPIPDLSAYEEVKRWGVNDLSLCLECWNETRFEEVCPGKARRAGRKLYLDAIEHCARVVRFDTTNGEIIAGIEDPADTMAGIDAITELGAVPTVSVFRPVAGSAYAHLLPPRVEEMAPVLAHLYRRCMEHGLPIGIAPNVHVSIVLNPEECRWLLPPEERNRWPVGRLRLRAMRTAYGAYYRLGARRQRRREVLRPPAPPA